MTNWSSLSAKLKQEVVGRMDFRSRFRFRHVSKSSQKLVDATPLYIPRVVFNAKSETGAVLSIYLGIDKQIDVIYEKDKENGCIVKVMSFSYDNVQLLVADRHVDYPDVPMLALSAFKHVAMNQETLCGGVEFLSTNIDKLRTAAEVDAFYGHRRYRTRVLSYSKKVVGHVLKHVDAEALDEIQVFDENRVNDVFGDVTTYTKRVHVRVEPEEQKKWKRNHSFYMEQTYVPTKQDCVAKILESSDFEEEQKTAIVTKYKSNDFSVERKSEEGQLYVRATECGVMFRDVDVKMEESPERTECELRWACPKHGDPFEHWYMMKTARGDRSTRYDRPLMPPVKAGKKYKEIICPVTNGHCFVTEPLLVAARAVHEAEEAFKEEEFNEKVAELVKKKRNKQ